MRWSTRMSFCCDTKPALLRSSAMAENKTKPTDVSVDDYLASRANEEQLPDCRELMPADWLAWLNPNADPAMHALMQARTAQQLASQPQGDALLMRARIVLSERMSLGLELSLEAVTQALHADTSEQTLTSPRQLQKRLSDQGLSFKDLIEEVRRERALRLLRDTSQAIGDIAQACGYTEVSPFHRAVRRWTGPTPAPVRQQALTPGPHLPTPPGVKKKSPGPNHRARGWSRYPYERILL